VGCFANDLKISGNRIVITEKSLNEKFAIELKTKDDIKFYGR
jgi:hypothetical protein